MLFHIDYTYGDSDEMLPKYPECKIVHGMRIDRRNSNSPDKIPYYQDHPDMIAKDWYGTGKNHRVVDGKIEKDFDCDFCIIEINSLEDLMNFQDKYNVNASVSHHSQYVYNGEELNKFSEDYYME